MVLCAVFVLRHGYCNKNIGSELRCIERYVAYFFPLNVVTAKRHYRYRGITAFIVTASSSSTYTQLKKNLEQAVKLPSEAFSVAFDTKLYSSDTHCLLLCLTATLSLSLSLSLYCQIQI